MSTGFHLMTRGGDAANAVLARHGLEVRVLCVDTGSGLHFRADTDDPASVDHQRRSYRAVGARLGCIDRLHGSPRLVVPGVVTEPDKLSDDQLVLPARGIGYPAAENPNPACLGTVIEGPRLAGVAMPFDREPAAYFMYADTTRKSPFVVTAVLLGVWHRLPHGLVGRLLKLIREAVKNGGRKFSFNKLWAWVSPSGRDDGITIREEDLALLRSAGPTYDHFLYEGVGTTEEEPHGLNLTGLFHQQMVEGGIPRSHITGLQGVTFSDPAMAHKTPWGRLVRRGSDFIIIAGAVLNTAT